MPEPVVTPSSTSTATSSGGGTAINTGSSSSTGTEPRIGWAGHDTDTHDGRTADEGDHAEGADAASGEFGSEEFSDDFGTEEFSDADTDKPETSFKDLFEKLKSQDPNVVKAAEKQLKRDFFENRRYKAIPGLETPEKAREVADKIESFGGIEGIEKETSEAATLWNMLGAGDPAILDSLEAEYGDGITRLAPHVLDRFLKLDPQGWSHSMSKVFMATLNSAPAGGISALAAFNEIARKFPDVAKSEEFKRIADVINNVSDLAGREPEKKASAGDDKSKQRERELKQKENILYKREVSAKVAPITRQIGINALNQVIKGRKLSNDQKKTLLGDIIGTPESPVGEVGRLLKKNAEFQKNCKALLSAGETDKFLKMVKAAMERTMPLAARNVWKKYYGISGLSEKDKAQRGAEGAARTEAGGGGAVQGTIKTKTPNAQDVDWVRMRAEHGRDKAENMFLWERKYYKKGDKKNVYSY